MSAALFATPIAVNALCLGRFRHPSDGRLLPVKQLAGETLAYNGDGRSVLIVAPVEVASGKDAHGHEPEETRRGPFLDRAYDGYPAPLIRAPCIAVFAIPCESPPTEIVKPPARMRCRAGQNVKISAALIYRSHLLENLPWVEHGFGTRLTNGWPDASRLISLKQIHSDWVITARNFAPNPANAQLGEGDALITQAPGVLVSVRTADCIPILIADTVTHAVAAVHAGWRGTVKEVGRKTLETMSGQFGTQPLDVLVAIGPGIGGCCYEVGPEVAAEFGRFFPERTDLDRRTRIDLAEANRRQFETLGIPPTHIEVLGMCTSCCAGEFHSYRRDGKRAGRMVSAIGIRNEGK